jgi:hypothetical protein
VEIVEENPHGFEVIVLFPSFFFVFRLNKDYYRKTAGFNFREPAVVSVFE